MVQNILVVGGQVLALFFMIAAGFALTKCKFVTEKGAGQMASISFYVVTPCVIIHSLQRERSVPLMRNMGMSILIFAGVVFLGTLISFFFFRNHTPEHQRILRFAVSYSNCGYMGLPLVQAVLGESAVIYAAGAVIAFNLLLWTEGIFLIGGKKYVSLRKALLNPGTIGFAIGFLLFAFEITLPNVLGEVVKMFADMNTPLAMLIIGTYFAHTKFGELFRSRSLYLVCFLRLILIPAIITAALYPLHLSYDLYASSVITASAPVAAATTMFTAKFNMNTRLASQSVTLSTLLSILTMPIFASFVALLVQ